MKDTIDSIAYKRLRAPREDGQVFFDPVLTDQESWLLQNLELHRRYYYDLQGCLLTDLHAAARRELSRQARGFTAQYRSVPDQPSDWDAPVILAGHQPELVHPGVWFKNFALSDFASRTSAHAISLLVDNDVVRNTALRVPGGTDERPVILSVPLDRSVEPIPHEERRVQDPTLFVSGGRRVCEALEPLIADPVMKELWPFAVEAMQRQGNFGRAIAQARHVLEGRWGLSTLELPLSRVCDDWTFRWFAAHLLCEAERLQEIHNSSLNEYRDVHKIRSHTHPVPNLMTRDGWIEVPFWLWTVQEPKRRRAFVKRNRSTVELTDRHNIRIALPLHHDSEASRCVDRMGEMHHSGVRMRPRALITTMFSRLVLSDVFIHGIGGAKYDQLTDAIVRRFFDLEPPEFLIVSATMKLPVARESVETTDMVRLDQLFRDMQYHPECHLDATSNTLPLIAEKRQWIQTELPHGQRRLRHQNITRVNAALQTFLGDRQQQLFQERQNLRAALRRKSILNSRDYAFCLFPEESLRPRLLELSQQES